MAGRCLNVSESNPCVKCAGNERVAEAVRADPLGDPRPASKTLDGAVGGVAVHPPSLGAQQDGSRRSLVDVEVDRPGGARRQGDGRLLAALAHDLERGVPALEVEVVDVGTQCFGDAQTAEGQKRRRGMVTG